MSVNVSESEEKAREKIPIKETPKKEKRKRKAPEYGKFILQRLEPDVNGDPVFVDQDTGDGEVGPLPKAMRHVRDRRLVGTFRLVQDNGTFVAAVEEAPPPIKVTVQGSVQGV